MKRITPRDIHVVPGDLVTPPALGKMVRITKIDLPGQRVYYRYVRARDDHEWRTGIVVIAGVRRVGKGKK